MIITLYGPSGAGKTYVGKKLSEIFNGRIFTIMHLFIITNVLRHIGIRNYKVIEWKCLLIDILLSFLVYPIWVKAVMFKNRKIPLVVVEEGSPGTYCSLVYVLKHIHKRKLREHIANLFTIYLAWLHHTLRGPRVMLYANEKTLRERWLKRGRAESEDYHLVRIKYCPLIAKILGDQTILSQNERAIEVVSSIVASRYGRK